MISITALCVGFLGLVAGTLIGSLGVGGVIIVPCMIFLQIDVHIAIVCSMASYIFAGMVGVLSYTLQQPPSDPFSEELTKPDSPSIFYQTKEFHLCISSIPGAIAGAYLLVYLDPNVLKILLYSLMLSSALFSLSHSFYTQNLFHVTFLVDHCLHVCKSKSIEVSLLRENMFINIIIGLITGCGSAVTGTSGPVILLGILILLDWEIFEALFVAQFIQLPIAITATITNYYDSPEAFLLNIIALLSVFLCIGVVIGSKIAHSLPISLLKTAISLILLSSSIFLISSFVTDSS